MGRQKTTAAKAYKVRVSHQALRNIDEITGYIAFINLQPANAVKVGDALFETIDRIAVNPYSFKECEELPTKDRIYRKAVCQSWLIIYRVVADDILILGILHKSRRPTRLKALRKIN